MLTKRGAFQSQRSAKVAQAPRLNITKLGIVSRDYGRKYENGYRDFSHVLPDVLKLLDNNGCDAVLFSLHSIAPRKNYNPLAAMKPLKNIKAVFLEFLSDPTRTPAKQLTFGHHFIFYRSKKEWRKCERSQKFGSLSKCTELEARAKMDDFVQNTMSTRTLGNSCILLCGEINGVRYSRKDKKINDRHGLRAAIPHEVKILLNPAHDRMTRFEMKLKRKFLSENNRWVISVWNKGKKIGSKNKPRDGTAPAWAIFHGGNEKSTPSIGNSLNVEIGILDFAKA